eukprot:jgi/Ulvmu1/3734/UM173_0007.1
MTEAFVRDGTHRWTCDGETSCNRLHSGKADLMQTFVAHSRRWTVSDPQISISQVRGRPDSEESGNLPQSHYAQVSASCQLPRQCSQDRSNSYTRRARTMSQLFTDEGGLARSNTLEDQQAVQQLHSWTAQVLQQLLRSAKAANKATRHELELACEELRNIQHRRSEAEQEAALARERLAVSRRQQAAAQSDLDAEAERVTVARADVGGYRRQLEELRVTCSAKQQMIGAAQDTWSGAAASCSTRAVPPPAAAAEGPPSNFAASLKSKLRMGRLSLRKAVGEVGAMFQTIKVRTGLAQEDESPGIRAAVGHTLDEEIGNVEDSKAGRTCIPVQEFQESTHVACHTPCQEHPR